MADEQGEYERHPALLVGVLGVISDTHGVLRPEAVAALGGCREIIHAGDVGNLPVLNALQAIAPTKAIRGNVDKGAWAAGLPARERLVVNGATILILHDLNDLDVDPAKSGIRVVISGHSHQPRIEETDGVLYLNPGSAGPRRFHLPVTLAHVEIDDDGRIDARLIDLLAP